MARKVIALCVTGYNCEYETMIVEGVYNKCQEENINLLVFNPLMVKPSLNLGIKADPSIVRGESEIFNLINYDHLDGIVMVGESFMDTGMVAKINDRALERNIPVVNINDPEHPVQYNIELSDKNAMETVMRHLVEDHGLRIINFVGGFPGNLQTEERLAAYKKVLTENGIPIEEDRIDYGHFWREAVDCVDKFMKAPVKPQAIAFANDTMAFFAMDYLKEHGYSIPDDIVITGFDGIKDCFDYDPTLTSVRRAFSTSGVRAVEMLIDVWHGKKPDTQYVESELLKNQSCGCAPKKVERFNYYDERYFSKNLYGEFNSYLQTMNMSFAETSTARQLFMDLKAGADFFKLNRVFICICDGVENPERRLSDAGRKRYGLTQKCVSMTQINHDVEVGTVFSTADYVPVDIMHDATPCAFFFSPLYFRDTFLGYIAYEPKVIRHEIGNLLCTWTMQIANNAGSFYMKNELQYVVERLDDLYARDSLTGLYNRRGMDKNMPMIERAVRDGDYVACIVSDVDNLKKVNDAFGHEGGDTLIIRVAVALSEAFPKNAINVRTGGDEFLTFFTCEKEPDVAAMIRKVDNTLEDFNKHSGLPYKVCCSCGFVTRRIASSDEFDEMTKLADERMYLVKQERKAVRE
ncbi:MAG: GGDEF domain-containing protein [Lachnospiraceae bacterium]|nr:GGDEF domain-containing protein [Lachnospiraceae bacterium]